MDIQKQPLISVIIPTYNRAQTVLKALATVAQQTFTDYEIIIVDDGGTDDTEDRVKDRYGERIVYTKKQQNAGLSAARNTGIREARGTYIALLDDDDEWLPEKLALQIKLIQHDTTIGLVYCGSLHVNKDGEIINQLKPHKRGRIFNDLLEENYIYGSASAVLIRKNVLEKVGCFDENRTACEDWDLWIRIAQHYTIDYVDTPLVKQSMHQDNMHKDLFRMEQNTVQLLYKHLSSVDEKTRNRRFYHHYISFAWQQYKAGNAEEFRRLLHSALDIEPVANDLFDYTGNIQEQEKIFFQMLDDYWERAENRAQQAIKKKSYALQHLLLAWVYYHQNKTADFRRHMGRALAYSSTRDSMRLLLPYLKSFFGKRISENLHAIRKNIFSG